MGFNEEGVRMTNKTISYDDIVAPEYQLVCLDPPMYVKRLEADRVEVYVQSDVVRNIYTHHPHIKTMWDLEKALLVREKSS